MLDVHPPHHAAHGWRDFLIHIATIVVGLLIAIGLEQSVEWLHHKHLVREARENIHVEIENNHEAAQKDLVYLQKNIDRIRDNIKTVHELMKRPKNFHGGLINQMEFSDLSASAWRSARDTGALGYMPYDEVQRIADIYSQQDAVSTQTTAAFRQEFLAMAPVEMGYDIDTLPDVEYQNLLRENAATLIELVTLKQLVQQVDDQYEKELKRN
ncbi:MAG TPA: hypothetical protein VGN16_10185 [Acidobacteriaceae bacterium]|jgi:predicted RNase H-related nuclease YkuK (DUF458 family)